MSVPSIPFVAPIIRAAIATLEADLPGQITVFNAEGNVQLAAPTAYVFGAQDPLGVTGFPVVEVASTEGRTSQWAEGRVEVDHDARLQVVVWHEGDRGEIPTTYEMTLGLIRCVIECLAPPGAFGSDHEIANEQGIFWRTGGVPADFTADGREFAKWRIPGLVEFRLEIVERFAPA